MINKNEKGFALVLSLVLLMVMSLMGGALIVISSGDHQSNNTSDQYQQAFYVAETGLLEAEKAIINKYMGPYVDVNDLNVDAPADLADDATEADRTKHAEDSQKHEDWLVYRDKLNEVENTTQSIEQNEAGETITKTNTTRHARDIANRGMPRNETNITETECAMSFKNLDRPSAPEILQVTGHARNQSFYNLISPIFPTGEAAAATNVDLIATGEQIQKEKDFLKRFRYEFFSINIGTATYYGSGASIKKKSSDTESQGTAYKIYACGIMTAGKTSDKVEILIPLESLIVMPN